MLNVCKADFFFFFKCLISIRDTTVIYKVWSPCGSCFAGDNYLTLSLYNMTVLLTFCWDENGSWLCKSLLRENLEVVVGTFQDDAYISSMRSKMIFPPLPGLCIKRQLSNHATSKAAHRKNLCAHVLLVFYNTYQFTQLLSLGMKNKFTCLGGGRIENARVVEMRHWLSVAFKVYFQMRW